MLEPTIIGKDSLGFKIEYLERRRFNLRNA